MNEKLRDRATCVLIRDGKLLLGRGQLLAVHASRRRRGSRETIQAAAERELLEETGLAATRTEYLFVFETASNRHYVFSVEADGPLDEDTVRSAGEIHDFLWWDMEAEVPVYSSVPTIRDWLRVSGSEFFPRES